MRQFKWLLITLVAILVAGPAWAQSPAPTVDIYGPGQDRINLLLLPPRGVDGAPLPSMSSEFESYVRQNLGYLPFVNVVGMDAILGGDPSTGVKFEDIDPKPLGLADVDLVATFGWKGGDLQARVYDTLNGRRLVGKAYSDLGVDKIPVAADAFCSHFMKALTGRSGFFNSDLAFVRKMGKGREIFTASPQGREIKQVTRLGGINLSPEWSKDGRLIIFTHLGERQHSLGILDREAGKTRLKNFPGYTVISPAYLSTGEIAVTLSYRGRPDIYKMTSDFRVAEPLADSNSIDVSPSFDAKGLRMAFASGRMGNPHIFVREMMTGQVKRVTYQGKYNTSPCLSPDGRFIVFSRQMPGGHKLFVHDLITSTERQITFGPGSDEDPAFGPDGYFVAFSSNRNGRYQIYMTTRHGDAPKHVPTGPGEATAPAWDTSRLNR